MNEKDKIFVKKIIDDTRVIIPVSKLDGGGYIRLGRKYSPSPYVNGDKARLFTNIMCDYLLNRDESKPATIVGGMSAYSPYLPMSASLCKMFSNNLDFNVKNIICNASNTHVGKPYFEIAMKLGSIHQRDGIVGQGKGLQGKIRSHSETIEGSEYIEYAITPTRKRGDEYFARMYSTGALQVKALKDTGITKLYIPFGSANSSTAVMYGLSKYRDYHDIDEVVFVCVAGNAEKQKNVLKYNLETIFSGDPDCYYNSLYETGSLFGGEFSMSRDIKMTFINTSKSHANRGYLVWDYSNTVDCEIRLESGETLKLHPRYESKAWLKAQELFPDDLFNDHVCYWEIGGELNP